jgi:uncharacterized protein (TIGR02302 family)
LIPESPSPEPPPAAAPRALLARLRRRRLAARTVLGFERLWPALWPPLGLVGGFVCLALLDLPRRLPGGVHAALLAALGLGVLVLLVRGLRPLRLPSDAEADRRLERQSGLHHRPLAVLSDRPALPGAEALWRAHLARAAGQIGRLHVGLPHPGLAAIDRRALRGGLLVALVACFGIAGEAAPERLARSLLPTFAPAVPPVPTEVQGWITPPGYTNLAPLFLRSDGAAVSVPAGSHLTLSLSGDGGTPTLTLGTQRLAFQPLDTASFQADADLATGGRLVVRRDGADLAGWDVTVVADAPPLVRWTEPPGPSRDGRIPQTRLPWQVSHDYGVVALQAEVHLSARPDAPALVVQVPLPGGAPKTAKGVRVQDLTPHPWAGLPVVARLVARDAPGLVGSSDDAEFTLPERRFDNPTARALIAVRKLLTLHPDQRQPATAELDRISGLDEVWHDDPGGFLNLRAASDALSYDHADAAIDQVQARLWQLALHLEEGLSERTARALQQARQELRDAMQAEKRGEKLDPKELDRRIQALEKAIEEHLEALAEQLRRDPDAQQADEDMQPLDPQQAQELAEQMRQAIEQGRMQDAEQELAQLEQMLDALQHAKPGHRDAQARQRAQQRRRGQEQMNALQDMVQREGGLLDHAQGRASTRPVPNDPDRSRDARVQQALRRALGELMQQYGDLMGKIPPNLGDADSAMRDAGQDFAQGKDGPAGTDVRRAIEALQKGGQAMSEQMAQAFGAAGEQDGDDAGDDQAGDQDGPGLYGEMPDGTGNRRGTTRRSGHGLPQFGRRDDPHRDPLGRPLPDDGTSGSDQNADVTVPEQMEQARTRAIQEELRRRGADRSRPQQELDYIDRLLKQF